MRAPARLPRFIRRSWPARRDGENGFVLVWMALMLTRADRGFAGLAVDFWSWNREGARMQKAADAAALGGAVFMPENFAGSRSRPPRR